MSSVTTVAGDPPVPAGPGARRWTLRRRLLVLLVAAGVALGLVLAATGFVFALHEGRSGLLGFGRGMAASLARDRDSRLAGRHVTLDARLPRAVSIDVNLSNVPTGNRVLFLPIAGSSVDRCSAAAVGLPANPTVSDLARCWPHAALRMVQVNPRP